MRGRQFLWLIPAGLVLLLVAGILALPGYFAATAHRPKIEALASALTGRDVTIAGKVSLDLLPSPEVKATRVKLAGPNHETITARSLTLDISLADLLRGRISARNLTLDSPVIAYPWPLPGGPQSIAPPPWLAALHAVIKHGSISLGAAQFSDVDADIFTGSGGAVSISGTGTLSGRRLNLSLSLGAIQLTGAAPLTLDAKGDGVSARFYGDLGGRGGMTGQLELTTPQLSGSAALTADTAELSATKLQLAVGKTRLTGSAMLDFDHPGVIADLSAQNLDLTTARAAYALWPGLPATVRLVADNLVAGGVRLTDVDADFDLDQGGAGGGADIRALSASLPGGARLRGSLKIAANGALDGKASLNAPDLAQLLAGSGLSLPPGWSDASVTGDIGGRISQIDVSQLHGRIGPAMFSGGVALAGRQVSGAIHIARLDFTPLADWVSWAATAAAPQNFSFNGELTVGQARLGGLQLQNLLFDGSFRRHLNLRRFSAQADGGLIAGNLTLNDAGQVAAAHGFVSLPSAAKLADLLPPGLQPPPGLLAPRLDLTVFAAGPPDALATSAIGTLGDFSFTASPVLNLQTASAAGPLTLRHPNAIRALSIFGLNRGLAWPGPGSISLRAAMAVSPTVQGLPDFVLSLGALTASGHLARVNGAVTGEIAADTLALPPLPGSISLPWGPLAQALGHVGLSAGQVLVGGNPILRDAKAILDFKPGYAALAVTQAGFANGTLSGSLAATLKAGAPPAISASFTAKRLDAAALALDFAFPLTLSQGMIDASAVLTANGYTPRVWGATLGGKAQLTATSGKLNGFDLPAIARALGSPNRAQALRAAVGSGETAFDSLSLAATLDHGNCTLSTANLTSDLGSASAAGSIDLFDQDLALHLTLNPDLTPALPINMAILGPWKSPKRYPELRPALGWSAGS
ncbi:MAG: hypothetical protein B7Z80_12795 [Rhodospirillales bacterium 20-64-7]|nr:MAG: hypothetical protein B7Z80_12795 [Rhodospirillales bacterium 20-64-7]